MAFPLASQPDQSPRYTTRAVFDGITFDATTSFRGAHFAQGASFVGATFLGPVAFDGAVFEGDAWFGHATFHGDASFDDVHFGASTSFDSAVFERVAGFNCAVFTGEALMGRIRVERDACFGAARFGSDAWFEEAVLRGDAEFTDARFAGAARFDRAEFGRNANFAASSFSGLLSVVDVDVRMEAHFGEVRCAGRADLGRLDCRAVDLREAEFDQEARLILACRRATLERAVFRGGADLRAGATDLDLAGVDFGARPSLVAPLECGRAGARPRVISLRHARVQCLTLSHVDLRACRFAGAHGLEQLRLERAFFEGTPSRGRWTRRQTVADEHRWRAGTSRGAGWRGNGDADVAGPEEIAGIYRALRKAREDSKDEPGAADFYYGEMEMRRERARQAGPVADRLLLGLYWLISGYALRPSRAFLTLALVIGLFAALFASIGFAEPAYLPRATGVSPQGAVVYAPPGPAAPAAEEALSAVTFAVGTASAILAAPERPLTPGGSVLRVVLRILGPVLFGLVLLSIRGRVKR